MARVASTPVRHLGQLRTIGRGWRSRMAGNVPLLTQQTLWRIPIGRATSPLQLAADFHPIWLFGKYLTYTQDQEGARAFGLEQHTGPSGCCFSFFFFFFFLVAPGG